MIVHEYELSMVSAMETGTKNRKESRWLEYSESCGGPAKSPSEIPQRKGTYAVHQHTDAHSTASGQKQGPDHLFAGLIKVKYVGLHADRNLGPMDVRNERFEELVSSPE